jgi:hypothetical protein
MTERNSIYKITSFDILSKLISLSAFTDINVIYYWYTQIKDDLFTKFYIDKINEYVNSKIMTDYKPLRDKYNLLIISNPTQSGTGSYIYLFNVEGKNYIIKIGPYSSKQSLEIGSIPRYNNSYILEYKINTYLNILYFLKSTPHIILNHDLINITYKLIDNSTHSKYALYNESNNSGTKILSLDKFIYTYFSYTNKYTVNSMYVILFQLIYTLECFNRIKFKHNDLHTGNILIFMDQDNYLETPDYNITEYHNYTVTYRKDDNYFGLEQYKVNFTGNNNDKGDITYTLPYLGISVRVFDFDRSILYNEKNEPIIYSDYHYESSESLQGFKNIPGLPYINTIPGEYFDINKLLLTLIPYNNNVINTILEYIYKENIIKLQDLSARVRSNYFFITHTDIDQYLYFTPYHFIYLNKFYDDKKYKEVLIRINKFEDLGDRITERYSTDNCLKYWNKQEMESLFSRTKKDGSPYSSYFSLMKNNKKSIQRINPPENPEFTGIAFNIKEISNTSLNEHRNTMTNLEPITNNEESNNEGEEEGNTETNSAVERQLGEPMTVNIGVIPKPPVVNVELPAVTTGGRGSKKGKGMYYGGSKKGKGMYYGGSKKRKRSTKKKTKKKKKAISQ